MQLALRLVLVQLLAMISPSPRNLDCRMSRLRSEEQESIAMVGKAVKLEAVVKVRMAAYSEAQPVEAGRVASSSQGAQI